MLSSDDAVLLRRAGLVARRDPDEGLFPRSSWLRRVSAEPVLLLGGGRALLLEVAHPLVAAGVAEHSDFRSDPFGRLQRTLDALGAIAFGSRDVALQAVRGVERAHRRIRGRLAQDAGPFAAGTAYSGRDPELVLWVWATLVDTAIVVYERFVEPLASRSLDAYYRDQCAVARLLGVPAARVPRRYAAFRGYFDGMLASDVLTVTEPARQIAERVLEARHASARLVRGLTAGLLPPRLRAAYGLAWDPRRAARLETLTRSVQALRGARAGSPAVDALPEPR